MKSGTFKIIGSVLTVLNLGSTKATAKVAEFLFHKATTEGAQCVAAAIFWMKTRVGWREAPQSHELAFKPASEMTDEELEARIRELDRQVRPMLELKPGQGRISQSS
jgi:hypothetical protein